MIILNGMTYPKIPFTYYLGVFLTISAFSIGTLLLFYAVKQYLEERKQKWK